MIDEFQDTDPQQYRIFQKLYVGRPDCGLLLIGDPKQAIYAFVAPTFLPTCGRVQR